MIEEGPLQVNEIKKPGLAMLLATGGCAIFICAMVFIGTLIFAGPEFTRSFIPNMIRSAESHSRLITHSNTMGDPSAPVHIIEYGDFQCPYCLQFWQESEPQMIRQYVNTGKVYFEFRSFPFLGDESVAAAEASYCAGDQGKFWEYHDTLFTNWTGENVGNFTNEKLIEYAVSIKLDKQEFESCLRQRIHKGTVEQDLVWADADGVQATPTFIINGNKVEGAQSFEFLQRLIEDALQVPFQEQSG